MKTDFDKKLVKGARLYLVRRYDGEVPTLFLCGLVTENFPCILM